MGRHSKFETGIPFRHPPYGGYGLPVPYYEGKGPVEAGCLYRAAALVFESLPPTPVLLRGIQAIEAWKQEDWPRQNGPVAYHGVTVEVEDDVLHLVTDGGRRISTRLGTTQVEWCLVNFRRPGNLTGSTIAATEVAARFKWAKEISAELARVRLSAENHPEVAQGLGITPESLEWDV